MELAFKKFRTGAGKGHTSAICNTAKSGVMRMSWRDDMRVDLPGSQVDGEW